MTNNKLIVTYERIFNGLELFGIALMLVMAFIFQLLLHELPCPLCLLQRVGFLGVAFGYLLNLRFGLRPSHYGMVLISALFTSFVALRQVALHVVPGAGSYGDAILGLHLYTWSFIISMLIVISTAFMLSVDRQYHAKAHRKNICLPKLTHSIFAIIILLIVANLISVFMECGWQACPDNPVQYRYHLAKISLS